MAAMNEVIFILRLEIMELAARYESNPRIGGSKNVAFEDGGGPAVFAI